MAARRSSARRNSTSSPGILLRYRESDTAYGVSRKTARKLADTLGLSETQVIHVALAQFARQNLPQYEPDDGPLTPRQMEEIRRLQPPGRMKAKESLF